MQNTEQIIYKQESKHILSAVKYKFGRQVSHKYYFYPDGTLAKVRTNSSDFVRELGDLTANSTNFNIVDYDRESFSYLIILFILCMNAILIIFAFGIVTFPASIIFSARLIYWHNKKYKFTTKEQQQFKNLTDNI